MDEDKDFDDIFPDDLPVRTWFPDSWLWRKITLPESGSGSISHSSILVNVPDSISTWQLVAVSLKAGQGLCVSGPFKLTVKKEFFVDLKLPSSVIRNKQVQIQAVLYNFRARQAKAGGWTELLSHSILLNPQGQTQTELVPKKDILNQMPDTEAEVFVSVQGDILGKTILGSLTPTETQQLLRLPRSCPEQMLSSLAPMIILTCYLDATGQWDKVGVEHRTQVMKNIVSGYTQMLTHRLHDGSYHSSKGSRGSTWLTSYVFRVFTLAYHTATVTTINMHTLCAVANWIITRRQAEDGRFLEKGPVIMASMQNLIASMKKASDFLEQRLPSIQTTFAIAIVSYALAPTNSPKANDCLDIFASHATGQ
ncbi:putative protein C3P1 isoform X4 [Equus asinus]|uniref:putative protein C3P1 isoform X4 n=1 Tax=Equus asinus TaxID=9793 RepID=UPI0038F78A06